MNYFIITAGATGSGKTSLVESTLQVLGFEPNTKYTKLLIDDLIENSEEYKKNVEKIIEDVEKSCSTYASVVQGKNECVEEKFNNPSTELFEAFNTAYQNAKNGASCPTSYEIPSDFLEKRESMSCSALLDELIKNISKTTPQIVVFETTGRSIPTWLLDSAFIPNGYKVVFSYSIVNIPNLVTRNKSRAFLLMKQFKEDGKVAPRLPDVSEETFTKNVSEIKETLIQLYNNCIYGNKSSNICGNVKIDRLLIFDNNDVQRLIYNSKIDIIDPEVFEKLIFQSFRIGGKTLRNKKR